MGDGTGLGEKNIVKNRVRVIGIRISSDVIQLLEYHSELQADTCLSLDSMRRRHSRHAKRQTHNRNLVARARLLCALFII